MLTYILADQQAIGRINDGPYWESFVTDLDRVITAEDYLIAPITIDTAAARNVAG